MMKLVQQDTNTYKVLIEKQGDSEKYYIFKNKQLTYEISNTTGVSKTYVLLFLIAMIFLVLILFFILTSN